MAARFTYSRWDGTQRGFDLDADALFDELTDDLLYHGDVNSALRRLMQQGMRDRNGDRLQGLRELMDKLRQERADRLERSDLGGVYQEIASELDDIVDEERHAIDNATAEAERSGDERRAEHARDAAMDRNFRLDMLPNDLAGKVRELSSYDFESAEAAQRFEQLMDKLRQQLMQQMVDQMSSAVQNLTPEDMQRTKDMLAALNEMLEKRANGEDPGFEQFMEQYGDFFPENPKDLDELLQQMAQRMAAMQAMMNSMTPEQRAQLQQLSDQLLEDMDLRWQMDQLGQNLRSMYPQMNWNQSYEFEGQDPMGFAQAMQTMQDLGDLDQLENLLRNATNPGALAEADMDRVRDLLGDDAAKSLERLAELTKMLEDAGLISQKEGRLELTPKGLRKIGSNALRDLFDKLAKDKVGQHQTDRLGQGHERTYETKTYEFGDPFHLDLQRTVRNAIRRQGAGTPVRLSPDDFEIERTEHSTRSSTVLMLDLSLSMPMRDNFLPAKKVTMALHSLITSQFPRDYMGIVGFSETARVLTAAQLPEVSWDFVYGTNMQHGFVLARQLLAKQTGTKQIIMITDGEPTAHVLSNGEVFFNYPPVQETVEATLREVVRCTREGIRINTFVLDATGALRAFVERLTSINRGRAFFTTPETLGDYVLVDFIEHKRQLARGRGGRRAG
uniref:Long form Mg-chelase associated protein n=1 Tax=uncultured bacterium A1Q1_fos_515 TaxID=1256581 RepID=L7VWB1_9BACT|nr:long form Mg-chelase associated protein [uncultured bacterium A1Q1_fos_515]